MKSKLFLGLHHLLPLVHHFLTQGLEDPWVDFVQVELMKFVELLHLRLLWWLSAVVH